ncbi:hypothetical protein [Flavobacterium sp. AJR]|uniref:hypothetical protein n=1 Tax=Flavobacterium sp. AJR TaxID=1979369 RepID=UPI000A3D8005|nr:hypothetical protein [Flavobacterium sp. AJR]OUL61043.1 hypothetical protein B8T70_17210 [Flavobacterium sp. AJR]
MNAQFSIQNNFTWNALNAPKTFSNKLQLSFVSSGEGFPNFGTVMAGGANSNAQNGVPIQDGSVFQLYFPHSESLGGVAPKVRLGLYDNKGWGSWETFLTTANANNTNIDWKAKKLNTSDDITTEGRISLRSSSVSTGDLISIYGDRLNAADMYGFGIEPGVLYAKTPNFHRWYIGKNADLGASSKMELNNTMLYVAEKIGIGTKDTKGYSLAVAGKVVAEEIKVSLQAGWPDFVFKKEYELPTLTEVEAHIKEKGYLSNMPSEAEVNKSGINLGEMDAKLLQKIEELTLYMIDMNKTIKELQISNERLSVDNKIMQTKIKKMELIKK